MLGRPDRDNAIDSYINGNEEDICQDGVWQKYFICRPEPLTPQEARAWLDNLKNVVLGSDAFVMKEDS